MPRGAGLVPWATFSHSPHRIYYMYMHMCMYMHVYVNFSYPAHMMVCLQSALKELPTYLPTHIWKDVTKLLPYMG
jgi:hypothetical protein